MTTVSRAAHTAAGRFTTRSGTVVSAGVAGLLVWAVAKVSVGDLRQPAFGAADPLVLTAQMVVLVSLVVALLGWASLAVLERLSSHAPAAWLLLAGTALLLSLGAPLSGHGAGAGSRIALLCMHLVVGGTVISLLHRSALRRGSEPL